MKKNTEDSGAAKPEGTAAPQQRDRNDSGKKPLWSRSINRVDASVWPHEQNGETRYTIALSRSYFDKKSNQWKRNYYFDRQDLMDLRTLIDEADARVMELEGLKVFASED